MLLLTVVVLILSLIFLPKLLKRDKRRFPPGPISYPLVGNLLEIGQFPHVTFTKWKKKYGNIFQCFFGSSRVVVLSDLKSIRDAFNHPHLAGRIDHEAFTLLSDGPHGVINSSGQEWVEQRRFTLRNLRDFGFGKNTMERFIMDEINEFLESLKATEGQPINLSSKFIVVVLNSLWMILTGKRYKHDDPRLTAIFDELQSLNEVTSFAPALFFPRFAKMFPKWTKWEEAMVIVRKMRDVVLGHINEHQINKPEDGNPRDFIDAYLKEIDGTKDEKSSFYQDAGVKSLVAVSSDLFIAGSDTTSQTLSWLVLYMSKFPEVQRKLQSELDTVVGRNRQVSLADRGSMPYAEAVTYEIGRIASIAAIGVFHMATEDTQFGGYDIPKGTWLCANLHDLHHNEEIWGDPENFRPERFLSPDDGKTVRKHEALIPFSVGKRACLGETLARDELFLFTTNIFQRFSVRLADDSLDVTFDPRAGIVLSPPKYHVVLTDRI